jgi:regulatory protein
MPKITNISRGKTNRDFVNVFLDDEFWFSCPDSAITDNYLFIGKEIVEAEVDTVAKNALFSKYYYRILNFLTLRPRSEWEVKTKLKKYRLKDKDKMEESLWTSVSEKILEKLTDSGYIDDQKFGIWFVDSRLAQKKKSWREIEQDLFVKGLSSNATGILREKYKAKVARFEKATIKKLAGKRLKSHNPEDILKFKNYLYSKGFNIDTINEEMESTSEN